MAYHQLQVLPQVDNFSCGYHSLKNALVLLQPAGPAVATQLCDKACFWSFFHDCLATLENIPDLLDKDLLHEGVLEPAFARQLLISHQSLSRFEKSVQLSLFPALACLESGLLIDEDIENLKPRITKFVESKEETKHVWIISSNVHHWITLQAEKHQSGAVQFSIADSSHSRAPLHPDVENLMNCLRGTMTLESMYLEAILRGAIKELQETIARCETSSCVDDDLLSESIIGTKQLFSQLSEQFRSLYPRATPQTRIREKLSQMHVFISARYIGEKDTTPLGIKLKEIFLNFKDSTVALIDWNTLQREFSYSSGDVWPFMRASSYGDIMTLRSSCISKSYISLWNQQLSTLPPTILSFTNTLCALNLSHNCLTALPVTLFTSLPHLRVLAVSTNKLSVFPEIPGVCSSLEELRLGSNLLTSLPPSISNLCNLRELILDSNRLIEIPKILPLQLRTLDLSRNKLTQLSIAYLTHLEALLIDHNQLQSVTLPAKCELQVLWSDANTKKSDELLASANITVVGYQKR